MPTHTIELLSKQLEQNNYKTEIAVTSLIVLQDDKWLAILGIKGNQVYCWSGPETVLDLSDPNLLTKIIEQLKTSTLNEKIINTLSHYQPLAY